MIHGSTFITPVGNITSTQLTQLQTSAPVDGVDNLWDTVVVTPDGLSVTGTTVHDNFDMRDFLDAIGVDWTQVQFSRS